MWRCQVKNTIIITAFFDIGRSEFDNFNRDNNKYLNHFKFWAGLKNDLIIYTEKKFEDDILSIRKDNGLQDKTTIITYNTIEEIDNIVYTKISKSMENELCSAFRLKPNNPESKNSKYNYLMYLKSWFMNDALKYSKSENLAWLDFGFNNNNHYLDSNEFKFELIYDCNDKINIFALQELDTTPIFEVVRNMSTYIQGTFYIMPTHLVTHFYHMNKNNVLALCKSNLCDDDQTIMLMNYREYPKSFRVHYRNWLDFMFVVHDYDFKIALMNNIDVNLLSIDNMLNAFHKKKYELLAKYEAKKLLTNYIKVTKQTLKKLLKTRKI